MTLPDLPAAPASDVQALALRLLRDDDFTAAQPLLDELHHAGRDADRKKLLEYLAQAAMNDGASSISWSYYANCIMRVLWWDLYALGPCLHQVAERYAGLKASHAASHARDYRGLFGHLPPELTVEKA